MNPKNIISVLLVVGLIMMHYGVEGDQRISNEEDLHLQRQLTTLNKTSLKTIKVETDLIDDIYDCIDINKQPALDHPLLKNHKIQMRPSFVPKWALGESLAVTNQNKGCQTGSVPIRRIRKVDILNANKFGNIQVADIRPQLIDSPNQHMVGVRAMKLPNSKIYGVRAYINLYNISLSNDQASFAQIWVEGGPLDAINTLQVGWMVKPILYGDGLTRSFTFWTGDGYNNTGCYNLLCPGFVQVSQKVHLGEILSPTSTYGGTQFDTEFLIFQDSSTGNWWLKTDGDEKPVGYWPKELVPQLVEGASAVGYGGFTLGPPNGASPPMGSGHLPDGDSSHSSYFRQLQVVGENNKLVDVGNYTIEKLEDSSGCYEIDYQGYQNDFLRYTFVFGGPGGMCSV